MISSLILNKMVNPSKKHVWVIVGAVIGIVVWIGCPSGTGAHDLFRHRRLNGDDPNPVSDHLDGASERNVWPNQTYDTSTNELMSSPCRPEDDGYFGSTSGIPLDIQFGFEMETEDDDNVEYLLEEIGEQIVDVVLSTTFPNLCGYRRRRDRARHLSVRGQHHEHVEELIARPRTTGFKFGMDLKERTGKLYYYANKTMI